MLDPTKPTTTAAPATAPAVNLAMGMPNSPVGNWALAEGGDVPDGVDPASSDSDADATSDSDGAIDTSDSDSASPQGGGDSNGSPQQDKIQQALQSVSQVLDLNRSLYGLGGQQQAAAMPMIPGSQSQTPGPYQPGTPMQPKPQQVASAEAMPGWNGGSWEGPTNQSPSPMAPGSQQQPMQPQQPGQIPWSPSAPGFGQRSGAIDIEQGTA
jgi:hypothetical protein